MEIIEFGNEKHIQINEFTAGKLSHWNEISSKYDGFSVDFCYHNTVEPTDFLAGIGATVLESCVEMRLLRKNYCYIAFNGFTPVMIRVEHFDAFIKLHDTKNPDAYWSGVRIIDNINNWCVYMSGETYIVMNVLNDTAEVFAVEASTSDELTALLSVAADFAFSLRKSDVLFMVDDGDDLRQNAAKRVGFADVGFYRAYRAVIHK